MKTHRNSFIDIAYTHFVPCFFTGLVTLMVFVAPHSGWLVHKLGGSRLLTEAVLTPFNGLVVAGIVWLFHHHRDRRRTLGRITAPGPDSISARRKALLVGFLCGSLNIVLLISDIGILILTGLVSIVVLIHLRQFTRDVALMLRPHRRASWSEVAELLRIHMIMLCGFTLLNVTLDILHSTLGLPGTPFGFGSQGEMFINAIYYTVVTMTTLGYGDLTPHTLDAKVLASIQCLLGYVMLALTVGVITRGVVSDTQLDDADE